VAGREIKSWRIRTAWALAGLADAAQIVFFPLFGQGALSPFEGALDLGVGVALTALVGFHWSFAPAFIMELVPMVDLAPTWTGAVFLATRSRRALPPVASESDQGGGKGEREVREHHS
jgi:hypothetical protein